MQSINMFLAAYFFLPAQVYYLTESMSDFSLWKQALFIDDYLCYHNIWLWKNV